MSHLPPPREDANKQLTEPIEEVMCEVSARMMGRCVGSERRRHCSDQLLSRFNCALLGPP